MELLVGLIVLGFVVYAFGKKYTKGSSSTLFVEPDPVHDASLTQFVQEFLAELRQQAAAGQLPEAELHDRLFYLDQVIRQRLEAASVPAFADEGRLIRLANLPDFWAGWTQRLLVVAARLPTAAAFANQSDAADRGGFEAPAGQIEVAGPREAAPPAAPVRQPAATPAAAPAAATICSPAAESLPVQSRATSIPPAVPNPGLADRVEGLLTGKGYHALPAPDGTAAAATWRLLIKNGTVFLVLLPGAGDASELWRSAAGQAAVACLVLWPGLEAVPAAETLGLPLLHLSADQVSRLASSRLYDPIWSGFCLH